MLLTWSRRDTYTLGFGPFPIVFSTNLFLWFKADWFYLAVRDDRRGVRRQGDSPVEPKDGRRTHVFNPSALTLTVIVDLALIVTGTSDITWGREIAITQFYPPHMYLFLFLVSAAGSVPVRRDDDDAGGRD